MFRGRSTTRPEGLWKDEWSRGDNQSEDRESPNTLSNTLPVLTAARVISKHQQAVAGEPGVTAGVRAASLTAPKTPTGRLRCIAADLTSGQRNVPV